MKQFQKDHSELILQNGAAKYVESYFVHLMG